MTERHITPTKITAWLDCAHFLSLSNQVDDGLLDPASAGSNAFTQMLARKGADHEQACLQDYERQGLSIYQAEHRLPTESFPEWVERIGNSLDGSWDVIYQMPFEHDGIRGIADFLIKVDDGSGRIRYEPVDAKLARQEAKPGHVLQLCFYAEAITALTGLAPVNMHLWLGSGSQETLKVAEFAPYWRRLRAQLASVLSLPSSRTQTAPQPCTHCQFCDFTGECDAQWRTGSVNAATTLGVSGICSSSLWAWACLRRQCTHLTWAVSGIAASVGRSRSQPDSAVGGDCPQRRGEFAGWYLMDAADGEDVGEIAPPSAGFAAFESGHGLSAMTIGSG